HQPPRVLELPGRIVDPDGTGAEPGQRDRPLRRAAAELERILSLDVAENAELRLRDLPHPPAGVWSADELAVPLLVVVARPVPPGPVPQRVRRTRHRRTRARPPARPTRASRSRGRGCRASRAPGRPGSFRARTPPDSSLPSSSARPRSRLRPRARAPGSERR